MTFSELAHRRIWAADAVKKTGQPWAVVKNNVGTLTRYDRMPLDQAKDGEARGYWEVVEVVAPEKGALA